MQRQPNNKTKVRLLPLLSMLIFSLSSVVLAETDSLKTGLLTINQDTGGIYQLGKITIVGQQKTKAEELGRSVDQTIIGKNNSIDIEHAIGLLPGVTITNVGPRNEQQVYIRGFSSQQVGLFLDGIPIYVPYDGNVDLARFTTFDVGQLNVEKGLSSILYGPNAMGGVINIVGRKPVSLLDISAKTGINSDKGTQNAVSVGSRVGPWYGMASASYVDQDNYKLSADYTPTPKDIKMGGQTSGMRNNAYHKDDKVSIRLGYNPDPNDEISFIGSMQHGIKGVPPYAGVDTTTSRWRYWKWPYWDKNSAYLIGKWQFGDLGYIKIPLYYDNFRNSLSAYDDSTYSSFKKKSSFMSNYNDYSAGGRVEYGVGLFSGKTINDTAKINFQYKNDYHSESNTTNDTSKSSAAQIFVQKPDIHFRDQTFDIAFENALRLNDVWTIVPGVGANYKQILTAENLIDTTKIYKYSVDQFSKPDMSAVDGQIALFYRPQQNQTISASVARRTRFTNMKDRYSYRLGAAIPNPGLKPEYAIHYQLSYATSPVSGLEANVSFFESQVYNVIQTVTFVGPNGESQMQNTGRARFAGYELDSNSQWALPAPEASITYTLPINIFLLRTLSIWANGSYITRRNLTAPSIYFVDEPKQQIRLGLEYRPIDACGISFDAQHESERISSSDGKFRTSPFTLLNLRGNVNVKWFTLDLGCSNIADVNYSLSEGYPEEGRAFYANLTFNFKK